MLLLSFDISTWKCFLDDNFHKKRLSHCEMQKPCISSTFWFVFPRLDQTDTWSFGKSVLWWKHNQFLRNSKIILTLRDTYPECLLMQYFLTNWQWTVFLNDLCLEFKSYCEGGSLHWGVTFSYPLMYNISLCSRHPGCPSISEILWKFSFPYASSQTSI